MCLNTQSSKSLCPVLHQNGFEVTSTSDILFAAKLLNEEKFALVLIEDSLEVVKTLAPCLKQNPHLNGLLISFNDFPLHCPYDLGLIGHISLNKPEKLIKFLKSYTKIFSKQIMLETQLKSSHTLLAEDIILSSPSMKEIFETVKKVAKTQSSVLITGESGTGKEVIARLIHEHSLRANEQFVAINSCAISPQLLESELFGYEKGAFTGAFQRKIGRLEYANFGTFFFDEIAETPLELQAKLLRVIQERSFERVGGLETIRLNIRFIAATNKNLQEAILKKEFREDLYYRLNVVPLHLPPLRERPQDIIPLAENFLKKFAEKNQTSPLQLSTSAIEHLKKYPFPGNIRELFNILERAFVMAQSHIISASDLQFDHKNTSNQILNGDIFDLQTLEQKTIEKALEKTNGNKTQAAKLLGLSIKTLRSKLR